MDKPKLLTKDGNLFNETIFRTKEGVMFYVEQSFFGPCIHILNFEELELLEVNLDKQNQYILDPKKDHDDFYLLTENGENVLL